MEADSTEHSAWDCSSVPSRVAHLLSYWMKHLDSGGKASLIYGDGRTEEREGD